jgi:hypothetical protein
LNQSPTKALQNSAKARIERKAGMTMRGVKPPQKNVRRDPDRFLTEDDKMKRVALGVYLSKRPKNKGDGKRSFDHMDKWFPLTETTGETDEEVAQISKLKYIPWRDPSGRSNSKWIERKSLGKYFQGLVVETNGKRQSGSKVIDFLSPDWVHVCFEQKFVKFVIHMALTQKRENKTIQDREIKWIDVPSGNVLVKPIHKNISREDVVMKYQQGAASTCVFTSFASLLHHRGHKDVANKIQQHAQAYIGKTVRKQLDGLADCVRHHDTKLKSLQLRSKAKSLEEWNPLEQDDNSELSQCLRYC